MLTDYFICEQCGCVDDIQSTQQTSAGYTCSECKDGEWHGNYGRYEIDPAETETLNGDAPYLDDEW